MTVSGAVKPLVRIPGKDHLYIGGLKICFQLLCYLQINILFQLTIYPYLTRIAASVSGVYDHHRPCLVCLRCLIMDSHQCSCLP